MRKIISVSRHGELRGKLMRTFDLFKQHPNFDGIERELDAMFNMVKSMRSGPLAGQIAYSYVENAWGMLVHLGMTWNHQFLEKVAQAGYDCVNHLVKDVAHAVETGDAEVLEMNVDLYQSFWQDYAKEYPLLYLFFDAVRKSFTHYDLTLRQMCEVGSFMRDVGAAVGVDEFYSWGSGRGLFEMVLLHQGLKVHGFEVPGEEFDVVRNALFFNPHFLGNVPEFLAQERDSVGLLLGYPRPEFADEVLRHYRGNMVVFVGAVNDGYLFADTIGFVSKHYDVYESQVWPSSEVMRVSQYIFVRKGVAVNLQDERLVSVDLGLRREQDDKCFQEQVAIPTDGIVRVAAQLFQAQKVIQTAY